MDSRNDMWIGTWAGGINYYDRDYAVFQNIVTGDGEKMINYNIISSILEDKSQNLWIGTEGGGINYYDTAKGEITFYTHDANDNNSISSNNVKTIIKDKQENLWIGTHNNGLNFLNTNIEPFEFVKVNPIDQEKVALSNYNITSLFIDKLNNLWIGTLTDGLLNYNFKSKKLLRLNNISKSINCIIKDTDPGFIIAGGSEGIEKINISTLKHEKIDFEKNEVSKDFIRVNCVFIDTKGSYWIGTEGKGVVLL
ncbi:DNA-binding response regulator [Algibacter lectus]|uniref:DNA-binding response regulator n=2 Tax=Algibacter lectus TaxID=221126 RepID=A0A090X6Y5_9FLAO|nr:two-component regulator propeller domain-containing protein [Algibacter lectus]GAL82092.1 DNA-binding response regulator [Algibacter lectus]